jgi:hypothetical protein
MLHWRQKRADVVFAETEEPVAIFGGAQQRLAVRQALKGQLKRLAWVSGASAAFGAVESGG